jgi:DNA uptake protein ComE-like DNA-binding protein
VIVISMLLVIVGAVTLVIGAFLRDDLTLVYVSIASCLLAGLFLVIGIVRSRPSRKPALASGGDGQEASWSGASSWAGDRRDGGEAGSTQVLDRDEGAADTDGAVKVAAEEDTPTAEAPEADPDERWQPRSGGGDDAAALDQAEETGTAQGDQAHGAGETPPPARGAAEFEELAAVSGVGPAKRQALFAHFGDMDSLRAATVDELAQVKGISATLAQRIHEHMRDSS